MIRIAVCATGVAERRRLREALAQAAPDFELVELDPTDAAAVACAMDARAWVLVREDGGAATLAPALTSALAARPAGVALIVVGGALSPEPAPTCWLADGARPDLVAAMVRELARPEPETPRPGGTLLPWRRKSDMIVGRGQETRKLLGLLDRLVGSSAPVLITGESGTGKELVARALHYCGPRADAPFIALNCAAIPDTLFETELFGYQRGAFTGAVVARAGAFESAHQGTLFLDEIGELPRALQPKLLRVLQTGEVTRVGSTEPRQIAVRVVAATNRRLETEVSEGRFREDLYYRLCVCPVHVAPLRERPEDIPALVHHHLALIAARERRSIPRLTAAALEKLLGYDWPGNVRELINALERALLVIGGNTLDAGELDVAGGDAAGPITSYRDAKSAFESRYYSQVMRAAGGNVSLAAKLAHKTRKEVYDALKRLGHEPIGYRAEDQTD